jgi:hypothetical protein
MLLKINGYIDLQKQSADVMEKMDGFGIPVACRRLGRDATVLHAAASTQRTPCNHLS